jgi:hypothetical protein
LYYCTYNRRQARSDPRNCKTKVQERHERQERETRKEREREGRERGENGTLLHKNDTRTDDANRPKGQTTKKTS